jgi:hypothetical protein
MQILRRTILYFGHEVYRLNLSIEAFKTMGVKRAVLWDVMTRILLKGYQYFGGTCMPDYSASQPIFRRNLSARLLGITANISEEPDCQTTRHHSQYFGGTCLPDYSASQPIFRRNLTARLLGITANISGEPVCQSTRHHSQYFGGTCLPDYSASQPIFQRNLSARLLGIAANISEEPVCQTTPHHIAECRKFV